MPSSQEIARVMAEMDRFNQTAKMTVTEERYEKRVASVGGSYGGLTALLQQGAPGNWASDHKSEAEKFAGWHYVAISSIGKAVRSANCEAYQEKVREYAKAYNEQDDDSEPLQKWHPLMKLLKRPNPSQSGASFREEVAIQLCLTGSALIWNVPNQMGRTVERYVIPTAIAEPRQPERGRPKGGWYINPEVARWQIESGWFLYTGLATAIGKVIDARDVQVVRFIHPVFKDEGQSPVSAGALWTDTSEKVDISRHSHLRNGSDPSVIIGIDGVEDEGTLQRMSAKFNEKYAGPSKHGKAMFVNGQNVKVEPVTRTPAEMAYEGAFLQFRDAIMALHGVTPIAAGIEAPSGDDGLYAPLKQFISGTVQPILDLMAEEDTEQLAGQFGEGISVLYTAKAVDDAKLTEQQINTDIAAGAIEVDEIRKLRGRKPWGGEKGKAVAGQGAKEEPKPGLPGLAQGVPGLEPQTGSQALDPSKPPQGTPDPMKLAEEAVAKALGGFADRLSALLKTGDNCGANAEGGGGFQPGNTCGRGDGSGDSGGEKPSKKKPSAKQGGKSVGDEIEISGGKYKVKQYDSKLPSRGDAYPRKVAVLDGPDGKEYLLQQWKDGRWTLYLGRKTQETGGDDSWPMGDGKPVTRSSSSKGVKEFEDRILKHVDKVTLRGIEKETAGMLADSIERLYSDRPDLPKLKELKASTGGYVSDSVPAAMGTIGYGEKTTGTLFINSKTIGKDGSSERGIKETEDAFKIAKDALDSGRIKDERMRSKAQHLTSFQYQGSYHKHGTKAIIEHELGHYIDKVLLMPAKERRSRLLDGYKEKAKSVSARSWDNEAEYIAEVYAFHRMGETVDERFSDWFKELGL